MEGIINGSDGAALAPLVVGIVLAAGYLVKLGIDYAKGKPQKELSERKERQEYQDQLREDKRRSERDAEDLRKLLKVVRHERDALKEYAWDLRGEILRLDPSRRAADLQPFPCPQE